MGDIMIMRAGLLKDTFPAHEHNFFEIIIFTEGTGVFLANNQKITFSPGTIIVVPPKTVHKSIPDDKLERIYIYGEFDWMLNIQTPYVLSDNTENEGLFLARIIYQNQYNNPEYATFLANAFLIFIIRNIKADDKINIAIKTIINEITNNFFDCSLDLNLILNSSGYAEDYIRAQFKKATGKTPVKFLTEIRISHSRLLMEMYKNTLSLEEIAERCGFTDYVYFSKRFKEYMGISPRAYINLK